MSRLFHIHVSLNTLKLQTGDTLHYPTVNLDERLNDSFLDGIHTHLTRKELTGRIASISQKIGVPMWCTVIYPEEYPLGAHVANVRKFYKRLPYSSFGAIQPAIPDANYHRTWVSFLYFPTKEILDDLAGQSDMFARLHHQLHDVDSVHQWVYLADRLDPDWVRLHTETNWDNLESGLLPAPIVSSNPLARAYCSMAKELKYEYDPKSIRKRSAYLEQAVHVAPDDAEAWYLLAQHMTCLPQPDYRRAALAFLKAYRLGYRDINFLEKMAYALSRNGQPRAAIRFFMNTTQPHQFPIFLSSLFYILHEAGRFDDASACIFAMHQSGISDTFSYAYLAESFNKFKQPEKALIYLNLLAASEHGVTRDMLSTYHIHRAKALYDLGQYSEAMDTIEKFAKSDDLEPYGLTLDSTFPLLKMRNGQMHEAWYAFRRLAFETQVYAHPLDIALARKQYRLAANLNQYHMEHSDNPSIPKSTMYYHWKRLKRQHAIPPEPFPPDPRPDYAFCSNTLFIRNIGNRIAITDQAAVLEETAPDRWMHLNLPLRILRPGYAENVALARDHKERAFARWRATQPRELVEYVQPFGDWQLPLLLLLRAAPDLLHTHGHRPGVLYMLANMDLFRIGWPCLPPLAQFPKIAQALQNPEYFLTVLNRSREDFWSWLPEQLLPDGLTIHTITLLEKLYHLYPDTLNPLRGSTPITKEMLELAIVYDPETMPHFIDLMFLLSRRETLPPGFPSPARILSAYLHITQQPLTRRIESMGDLLVLLFAGNDIMARNPNIPEPYHKKEYRLRENYRAEWRNRLLLGQRTVEHAPFPYPPFPGTPDIVPLLHPEELRDEARLMRNYFVTYLPHRMHWGTRYLYRVLAPERATLCLTPSLCNSYLSEYVEAWHIEWLLGKDLTPVKEETCRRIEHWLLNQQVGL